MFHARCASSSVCLFARRAGALALALTSAAALVPAAPASAAAAYTILDLGATLGTSYATSEAHGINASGQVVGQVDTAAFRTASNGPITAGSFLGTLGGSGTESNAFGVNNSGQAVGVSDTGTAYHAFRTAPDGPITAVSDLGTLGGSNSYAYGINDSGQTVGAWARVSNHSFVAQSSRLV